MERFFVHKTKDKSVGEIKFEIHYLYIGADFETTLVLSYNFSTNNCILFYLTP